MMGVGIWQLLILLAIVVLLFGTKRLRNLGDDLGSSIKNFRGAVRDADDDARLLDQDRVEAAGSAAATPTPERSKV
jgi:sec-independent protein translocase protein TatA